MKKNLLVLFLLLMLCPCVFATDEVKQPVKTYSVKNKFGLKSGDTEVTKAEYTKLIRLGDSAYIAQKRGKYGIIDYNGQVLIPLKYRWADRVSQNLVILGTNNDYGMYDESGRAIVPPEYSLVKRISKDFFLTRSNYKYGLVDMSGRVILQNKFDQIFIPDQKTLVIQYKGEWYKLDVVQTDKMEFEIKRSQEDDDNTITELIVKTGAISGYSVVTFTDYVLKLFSSLSPAYEATIDELMFAKGADAVSVIMKFSWLPKMPLTFLKNYYKNIRNKESDILAPAKNYLEKRI